MPAFSLRPETLAGLRANILALPEREQARWVGVVAELMKAAERGGPFRFIARVAFSRALHGVSDAGPPPKATDKNAAWKAKRASAKKRQK